MSYRDYAVSSLTVKAHVYANRIFYRSKFPSKFCIVDASKGKFVYACGEYPEIVDDRTIALSAPQRNALGVGLGSSLKIAPYELDPKKDYAHEIKVSVESLAADKRVNIKESDLKEFFMNQFQNFPVNRDASLILDFNGTPLLLNTTSVRTMVMTGKDDFDFKNTSYGFISRETAVNFTPAATDNNRFFKLIETEKPKQVFNTEWNFEALGIGGLDKEAGVIFRRAFASRLLPAETISRLGVKHVKGMLLYGPPGTGKTLIARKIGSILGGVEPEVVNGPEILNKYVGEAEANIRAKFQPAMDDWKANGENAQLHVIIFDEIDSICKKRGSVRSGTGVHDTVVNQLLTMIDGVDSPNNILVIGMTNRKDLLDPALLRPGRLEVHVEISLPDEPGRQQILKIHTASLRENDALASDVNLAYLAEHTANYAGGELEGLVKNATSYAIANAIDLKKDKLEYDKNFKLQVTSDHFLHALSETTPAFGVAEDDLKALMGTIYDYTKFNNEYTSTMMAIKNDFHNITTVLIKGKLGVGKTAFASKLALDLKYPYAKLLASYHLLGMGEQEKVARIAEIFEEAFKSPQSVLVIDDIERIIEYTAVGPRFSNTILQGLIALLTRPHPNLDRKLTVILTTNRIAELTELGMQPCFQFQVHLPVLVEADVQHVSKTMGFNLGMLDDAFRYEHLTNIGIKRFTTLIAIGQRYANEQKVPLNQQILESVLRHMPVQEEY